MPTQQVEKFLAYIKQPEPLITAIVPSYNKAGFLDESVGSVLQQEYKNIEILVVDDGSPDNTESVVASIKAANHGRTITYLRKQNGGISDARNYGIARANGQIILALDGDDLAKPTFVSTALKAMRELGANMVTSNVELFGKESGTWTPNQYEQYAIRYDNSIPTLVMFDKGLWEQCGGYRVAFPFVEDWDFFINCSKLGLQLYRIPEFLFKYRSSDTGLASIFTDRYRECLSLVITSNESLYAVEEILWAHEFLGKSMPQNFIDRFNHQLKLHPKTWHLKFWLGLVSEFHGNAQDAVNKYSEAVAYSNYTEWQPLYRLGCLLIENGILQDSIKLLHTVRIQRPDMSQRVQEYIERIHKSVQPSHTG